MSESGLKQKSKRLSVKISKIASLILVLIFAIVIITAIIISNQSTTKAIKGEFRTRSDNVSSQTESIFRSAQNAAEAVTAYLESAGSKDSEQSSAADAAASYSQIYNVGISQKSKEEENYITETVRQSVKANEDVVGMGVLFEPYAFDKNIKGYAFYISDNTVNDPLGPYGAYADYSLDEYYAVPKSTNRSFITAPYDDAGYKMVTYCIPIMYQGEFKGVITADINVSNFSKIVSEDKDYSSQYTTIVNADGIVIYDTESIENVGAGMQDFIESEILSKIRDKMNGTESFEMETIREDGVKEISFYSPIISGETKWWSVTALESDDMLASVRTMTFILIAIAVVSLVIIVGALFLLIRKMLLPINDVVEVAEKISHGDLNVQLKQQSNDEIGRLVKAFNKTVAFLKEIIGDQGYLLDEMAAGNFDVYSKAEGAYLGNFSRVLHSVKAINHRLSTALGQINQSAEQVAGGSEQVSFGSQALSQGATEQAAAVEELAATINEISEQVKGTAHNAEAAREQTAQAADEVAICNRQMQEMIMAMDEISDKSSEIGKIIKTIEDIAFQTNILALNAAVEAARAGAAGKGFAVVADEVRSLASKSAEASKNTSDLIEGSIQAMEKGSKIADETARSLMRVVDGTQAVTVTVDEIAKAAEEQASSIVQVTQGIDQISSVVQTNSATAEESAAASEELSGQAQILKELVGQFKLRDTDSMQQQADRGPLRQETPEMLSLEADKY